MLLTVFVAHIVPLCVVFWFPKIAIDGDTIYTNYKTI